jgi:hypothetical protein
MLSRFCLKVKAEGFVPAADLRAEFGPEAFTQAIAILYRDFRMFREVRRAWTDGQQALGYEWAHRKFSKSETKKIPGELGFVVGLTEAMRPKYGDFEAATVQCVYTAPILGSVPVKDEHGDPTNVFERDALGNFLILRYHQRAMASVALPMIGKEAAAARRIGWSIIRIPASTPVKIVEHGIVEPGRGGMGLRRSECLADGLRFRLRRWSRRRSSRSTNSFACSRSAGNLSGSRPRGAPGLGILTW